MSAGYRVELTPLATDDLESIRMYVSLDSPDRADDLVERVLDRAESLAEYPRRARPARLRGRKGRDIREYFEPPFWIVFEVRPGLLRVLRIWHSARRPPKAGDLAG